MSTLNSRAQNWKRKINILRREKGEAYTDYKNRRVPEKSSAIGIQLCTEKCRLKCNNNFSDADRNTLFMKKTSIFLVVSNHLMLSNQVGQMLFDKSLLDIL